MEKIVENKCFLMELLMDLFPFCQVKSCEAMGGYEFIIRGYADDIHHSLYRRIPNEYLMALTKESLINISLDMRREWDSDILHVRYKDSLGDDHES